MKALDLTGQRFGRLTVIDYAGSKRKKRYWNCVCECGNIRSVVTSKLTSGHTKSCGCLAKDINAKRLFKHGHSRKRNESPTYNCWRHFMNRCTNKNVHNYRYYGGRGISVCERWQVFENFLSDMGEQPEGYQIDRIDNNRGYEPGNCRWVTVQEQANNKRNNHFVTYRGETKTLAQWHETLDLEISVWALYYRYRNGFVGDRLFHPTKL